MRQKYIVKAPWLSFLQVTAKQATELQALILSGRLQGEKNIPSEVFSRLSTDEISFIIEKTHQVLGRPALILESLKDMKLHPPTTKKALRLWQERVFLKGFALCRLGRSEEANPWFEVLPQNFQAKIQTEKALIRLNQGEFIEAESLFLRALHDVDGELDPYSQCTLLGGLSLALIQQGAFREAEKSLRRRRQILKFAPSPTLAFGTRLYEILLLLEQNDFDEAREILRSSLLEQSEDSINGFFLRSLELRLHLARNELREAFAILENFKTLRESQKLPQGVLDFRLEEIEWNLRSQKPDQALHDIHQLELQQKTKNDHFFSFRLALLRSQAYYLSGDLQSAYREITQGIEQGEKRHYLPTLTWALFHSAGISLAAGYPVQAKLFLQRGERLARQLGLRVRYACFSYIAEVMEKTQSSGHALLSLVRRQEIGPEMEYYLGSYSLLTDIALTVSSRRGQEILAERDLRRRLFQEPGLFWFQKEEILLANLGETETKFADFSEKPGLLTAFRLFWNSYQNHDPGFTLAEIHQTRSRSTYREELHASAAKMLISQLRDILQPCGLKISYNRDEGRYSLQSALSPFTLLSKAEFAISKSPSRNRTDELLARIAMEPFVSTRVLCHEFNVSRQALHPHLTKLVAQKRIRMVKRGPISGYIFISKE